MKHESFELLPSNSIKYLRQSQWYPHNLVEQNLEVFIKKECEGKAPEEYNNIFNRVQDLYERNSELFETLDFNLLGDKIFSILGKEKLELLACYPEIQAKILKLSEDEILVFSNCWKALDKKYQEDEWIEVLYDLLDAFPRDYNYFVELLSQDTDYTKLVSDLLNPTDYIYRIDYKNSNERDKIKQEIFTQIRNGENISKEYEILFKMTPLERKKLMVFDTIYGYDIDEAKRLIQKFGDGIDKLEQKLGRHNSIDYIKSLKMILDTQSEKKLDELLDNTIITKSLIDHYQIERNLKNLYAKEWNMALSNSEKVAKQELIDEPGLEGYETYNAGTNFIYFVTSLGAYYKSEPENFYEDWNRKSLKSQGFCGSFIRNSMRKTAPIPYFLFGFNNFEEGDVLKSAPYDMHSDAQQYRTEVMKMDKYYCLDDLLDNTEELRHNEVVVRRGRNGIRKQPDFIVAFRKNGKVENCEAIKKAVDDFKSHGINLKIKIIDENECLRKEEEELKKMLEKWLETKNATIEKAMKIKISNNKPNKHNEAIQSAIICDCERIIKKEINHPSMVNKKICNHEK